MNHGPISKRQEGRPIVFRNRRLSLVAAVLGVLTMILAGACSGSSPETATPESPTVSPESDATPAADGGSTDPTTTETADGGAVPTVAPEPTLADEPSVDSVEVVEAGDQIEDAQGNLIAVYGFIEWPAVFVSLADEAQRRFPFFDAFEDANDPESVLLAVDVGMCSAGPADDVDGTAEFFLHQSADAPLSSDTRFDRGVLTAHPVILPGFEIPKPAECSRGWLPVLRSDADMPEIARYVLTTRNAAGSIERHVYQWHLGGVGELESDDPADGTSFGIGETVTFNDGRLEQSTVRVDGWAEYVGVDSPLGGTRVVGVSLRSCGGPGGAPTFGLGVDGWNIVAEAADREVTAGECFEGWIEFLVPLGGVPTAFFASDGARSDVGYAEWSLASAAIAPPS